MTQQSQASIFNAAPTSASAPAVALASAPAATPAAAPAATPAAAPVATPVTTPAATLYSRIVQEVIDQIKSGRLKPGDTLTSSRDLAAQLELSRGTVRKAYQELIDRGFADGRPGSKTVVKDTAPLIAVNNGIQSNFKGSDCLRMLPLSQWREKALSYLSSGASPGIEGLSEENEFEKLRNAICTYLLRYKGIKCDISQLNIFANRRQALDAVAGRFGRNEAVAVDSTADLVVQKVFASFGAELRYVNTQSEGTAVEELNALEKSCRTFLTTPTDEYLTGSVMPRAERNEILRWARLRSVTILEEASECESQYCPAQIPSFYELSDGAQVNYIYSFGKMLNPLTDITIVVTSKDCKSPLSTRASRPSLMEIVILADLIVDGGIDSFIRRRHRHYRKLRQAAYFETSVALGRFVKISPQKCTYHLIVDFNSRLSTEKILRYADEAKLSLTVFADYYQDRHVDDSLPGTSNGSFSVHPDRYLLNFLCQTPEDIAAKIRRFASILAREIAI